MSSLLVFKEKVMKWAELKEQVRDLGFEEDATLEESAYESIMITSTNRALKEIASFVPVVGRYEFEQDGKGSGIIRYDMSELTDSRFLDFDAIPVRESETYERFNDFEIEEDHIIVMDASVAGKFSVFYKLVPTKITSKTKDNDKLDIHIKAEHLLPLLVAYYMWLDDDMTKAGEYKQNYEILKGEVARGNVRARIRGGF